ncbi:MAG TPA: TetR/AcrR family transcriptional regulator [Rhizomicrobium sp.]|nr:TetR/AcrR family transcriptional regulator [Rhizomicrobium sp.]
MAFSNVYTVYMDTKAQILAAARDAFDRNGMEGLSMRDIAKEVGITPMAIYRHYENKQALIDALVLDALGEWSAIVAAIPPAAPLQWLRDIGTAHLDFALQKPRRYEAAFLLHSDKARRYPDDFLAGQSPAGSLQLRLLEELVAKGILKPGTPIEFLITNAGLSQGLITLYRAGRIAGSEDDFRRLYLRAIGRAIEHFLTETHS